MNWEALGAIGELVAATGVMGTLLFVGIQVRLSNQQTSQANKIARGASQRDLLKQTAGFFQLTFDNPTVLQDIRLGLMSYDNASHESKNNFATWAFALLHIMEQCVYMHEDDLITDSSFNGFETVALGIIVTPGGAEWWMHTKKVIGMTLVEHLDKRLVELEGITPPVYELLTQFAPIEDSTAKPESAPQ
ncbi:MAG: hypothetical protein ACI9VI_003365 [Candidatus Azotimanducaceae bacterium]|jgi:hypothetical protein